MLAMYSKLYTVVRTEEILPLRPYCPACLQGLDQAKGATLPGAALPLPKRIGLREIRLPRREPFRISSGENTLHRIDDLTVRRDTFAAPQATLT